MSDFISRLRGQFFRWVHSKNGRLIIDKELILCCRLSIRGPGRIRIGDGCSVRGIPGARINMVTLYTHSPDATITIGRSAKLVAARFSCRFAIDIGNNVIIEDASLLDTDFHSLDISRKTPTDESLEKCRIIIGDDVIIGSRAIISKGVSIGKGSIIHPGSVVQKSFPDYSEIIGNPARLIGRR